MKIQQTARLGFVLTLVAGLPHASFTADRLPHPYLALFTFQSAEMLKLTDEQLRMLDASPYDGMATFLTNYRSTEPSPDLDAIRPRLDSLRGRTRKHLWPVVFLNRIIEQGPDYKRENETGPKPEFAKIRGLDLDDKAGARSAFLLSWRRALQIARELRSPGICFDPEFYNNYPLESVAATAKRRGEREGETLKMLHELGRSMTDIVGEEYPSAVLWCLFTRLCGQRGSITGAPGHVVQAMLDRAGEKQIPLTLVEGGEERDNIGYTNRSLDDLQKKILDRDTRYRTLAKRYPGLVLGGTISPWLDKEHRAYWMKDAPAVDTIEEFEPWFALLMQRLDFVWVYAAGNAYNVWKKPYSERFPAVLARAKDKARAAADGQKENIR